MQGISEIIAQLKELFVAIYTLSPTFAYCLLFCMTLVLMGILFVIYKSEAASKRMDIPDHKERTKRKKAKK